MPIQTNPAEFVLDLVSTDFAADKETAQSRLEHLHNSWDNSDEARAADSEISSMPSSEKDGSLAIASKDKSHVGFMFTVFTLLHRSFIKSYRDVIAYGIRIAMYLGLAFMMGTVWLRLGTRQENIQPFINALVSQKESIATRNLCINVHTVL